MAEDKAICLRGVETGKEKWRQLGDNVSEAVIALNIFETGVTSVRW